MSPTGMPSRTVRQTLVAAWKVKKRVYKSSMLFKSSLMLQNKALAEDVTTLKLNNRLLQVQNVALLKELQALKFDLATSRGNERSLLVILNDLKTHVDKATVLSSDLQAHVDMMIGRVSPDADPPERSDGCSRQPVDTTGDDNIHMESGQHPVQLPPKPGLPTSDLQQARIENTSTKSSDFHGGSTISTDGRNGLGSKPLGVEVQADRGRVLQSDILRGPDRRKAQMFLQPAFALHTSPVAITCEESPSLAPAQVIDPPPSSMAADHPVGTVLLNAEMELTASDGTEIITVESAVKKEKKGSVKNKEKTQVGQKAALLKAGKENKTLTDQGAAGDRGAEPSEARSPEMQSKPISTLLQICNRPEEVQPSTMQQSRLVSRIPKLRRRQACDLNPEPKSSRAKDSAQRQIPEDFQRFATQQLHSDDADNTQEHEPDDNDNMQEHDPCQGQQLHDACLASADTDATLQSSEPSHSLSLGANEPRRTRKRVKEMTPADRQGSSSDDDKTAVKENLIGLLRAKKAKKNESSGEFKSHDDSSLQDSSLDAGPADLDFVVPSHQQLISGREAVRAVPVVIPAEASPELTNTTTATDHGGAVGHSRRNRPRCRETFVVLERMSTSQTSTNTATDDGGVREGPTGEVHIPSRRNGRARCRETFVVPENNESSASETYEDPVIAGASQELTNTTTATDNRGAVGHSRRNRPRCRERMSTPQASTNTATDDGGVTEGPTGETFVVPENNNASSASETVDEDLIVISAESSPEKMSTSQTSTNTATDDGGVREGPTGEVQNNNESPASETYEDPVVPAEASPERVPTASEEDINVAGALRQRRRRHAAVNYKEPPINCKMRRGDKGTDSQFLSSPVFKTKTKKKEKPKKKSSHT